MTRTVTDLIVPGRRTRVPVQRFQGPYAISLSDLIDQICFGAHGRDGIGEAEVIVDPNRIQFTLYGVPFKFFASERGILRQSTVENICDLSTKIIRHLIVDDKGTVFSVILAAVAL